MGNYLSGGNFFTKKGVGNFSSIHGDYPSIKDSLQNSPSPKILEESSLQLCPDIMRASMDRASERNTNVAFFSKPNISSVKFRKMFFFSLTMTLSGFSGVRTLVLLMLLMFILLGKHAMQRLQMAAKAEVIRKPGHHAPTQRFEADVIPERSG